MFFIEFLERPGYHHVKNDGDQKSQDPEPDHHMIVPDGFQGFILNGFKHEEIRKNGCKKYDEVAATCYQS